jgi:hypothetical protein
MAVIFAGQFLCDAAHQIRVIDQHEADTELVRAPPGDGGRGKRIQLIVKKQDAVRHRHACRDSKTGTIRRAIVDLALRQKRAVAISNLA